ncbi:MAG: aminotransferase class V-fold PLP-dependent enzyme [Phycisphaeraceae bacterium]|nr:aminotransferase class V-fold PLP-dependent enzyme [Phycisphaeraceae bacterium]
MTTRRTFLGSIVAPAGVAAMAPRLLAVRSGSAWTLASELAGHRGDPEDIARDESFWAPVQRAFTVDRSIINLNNGGVSPAPAVVQEAMKRHLDFCNSTPPPMALWQILTPRAEGVRERIARHWGVDTEEIALTRNASEGLQVLQFGFDLQRGDEVLCTTHDYPRMRNTFLQRERREGIVLRQFDIPFPCDDPGEIVRLYERNITDRTKLILVSHIVFLTGQALPVGEVAALGRRRGIPVLIDGAHAFAHLDFRLNDLECDFYATSLHKWLFAPHGTGLLYVRRDRIPEVWPLMAAAETQRDDIRKFEEIGTHPEANTLAIAEALSFHQAIGGANKLARMRFLRDRWVERVRDLPGVALRTSLGRGLSGGIATVDIEGVELGPISSWLWDRHRIFVVVINDTGEGKSGVRGLRISPSVYTTTEEIDRFADALTHAIRHGVG